MLYNSRISVYKNETRRIEGLIERKRRRRVTAGYVTVPPRRVTIMTPAAVDDDQQEWWSAPTATITSINKTIVLTNGDDRKHQVDR
jgi:hypothetical protein